MRCWQKGGNGHLEGSSNGDSLRFMSSAHTGELQMSDEHLVPCTLRALV